MRKHLARNFAIFLSVGMIFFVSIFAISLYRDTHIAIDYFSYNTVDPSRITITSTDNVLQLFGKWSNSLSDDTVARIESDSRLHQVQVFRLVDVPVTANFRFFDFTFETDVPIFSVTDTALTGAEIPIGISRMMMDFYNTQFAGSSSLFPKMPSSFLLGQQITFTFGASKLFPSTATIASPITGKIAAISNDFPGFGIVLPESIVREKVAETGYALGKPYKIVAYMNDVHDRAAITTSYKNEVILFDADSIAKKQNQLELVALWISVAAWVMIGIMVVFFLFLLSAYFRERRDVFRMISIFRLTHLRSYVMTLGEPMSMIFSSLIISGIFIALGMDSLNTLVGQSLAERWIHITLSQLDISTYLRVALMIFIGFFIVVLTSEWNVRRKYIFR